MTRTADGVLADLVPDRRWTLVGGKGGVGKTTVAAALAIARADGGGRTLVLSLDPAHSLGDALAQALDDSPAPVVGVRDLFAMEVDAERARAEWLSRFRAPLARLLEGGTVLSSTEVAELLDLSPPGMDELAGLLRLAELLDDTAFERVVIDTAPTGHALRLLESPRLVTDWIRALEDLDAHRRIVAEALTRRPLVAGDLVREFLDDLQRDVTELADRLRDPARTHCVLITTPEPVVLSETRRYRDALQRAQVAVGAVLVNRSTGDGSGVADEIRAMSPAGHLPRLVRDPVGIQALRALAGRASARVPTVEAPRNPGMAAALDIEVGERWMPPADRELYIVSGKGGVGKSTTASALALLLAAEHGRHTLLFSVDPAGSLGDVWQMEVSDAPVAVPACPLLHLRQVDAAAAWKSASDAESEALGSALARVIGGGARDLPSRLPELTPPGVDELISLIELTEQLSGRTYDVVVLDTAPTGHFLRLLQAPALAREWAHAILRLMLRYRETTALGDTAARVLRFAQDVKALESLLQDPKRTFVTVVALPEALSVPETRRLFERLADASVPVGALMINRMVGADVDGGSGTADLARWTNELLALQWSAAVVAAPELQVSPVGPDALARFASRWRRISTGGPEGVAA